MLLSVIRPAGLVTLAARRTAIVSLSTALIPVCSSARMGKVVVGGTGSIMMCRAAADWICRQQAYGVGGGSEAVLWRAQTNPLGGLAGPAQKPQGVRSTGRAQAGDTVCAAHVLLGEA